MIDRPAARVEAGGFQYSTDLAGGVVEIDVARAVERRGPGGRRDEAEQHAQRGRLAGAVGSEETGDGPRPQLEGQVVDGGHGSEALGEAVQLDGGHESAPFDRLGGDRRL